ncbi:MAG: hypothetical protein ACF788_06850 [Novipirellula sp. JB048]
MNEPQDNHEMKMGSRGVSRPMAEAEMRSGEPHEGHGEPRDGDEHDHAMSHQDRLAML